MKTHQRRRGLNARVWRTVEKVNNRGEILKVADDAMAHEVQVWVYPQRSARAELAGQQGIDVMRIGCDANLEGVDLWSRVEVLDKVWDVVTPPSYHHGTRHTRHWSIDLRAR